MLAGCVGQPGGIVGGGTAGVIITSFSPEVPEVESGSEVNFFVTVKNIGDVDNTGGLNLELLGLDDWEGEKSKPIPVLKAADPARGLEGEEQLFELKLTAPKGKEVSITYAPTARATFNYKTESNIQFRFATSEQIRGTPAESTAKVTTTGGPFVITVRGKLPVISSTSPKAKIQLEIQNVGGGRAITSTAGGPDFIIFSIEKKKGAEFGCTPKDKFRLIGGKSRLITCTITALNPQPAGFATATLDIKLAYGYFVETTTSVTVLKKIE